MERARRPWVVFAGCTAIVSVALLWIGAMILRLEAAEYRARTETAQQQRTHRAMWRMDSWLSLFVAREAARAYEDYRPADRGGTPSTLAEFRSDYSMFHFQMDPGGGVSSPQSPSDARAPSIRAAWDRFRADSNLARIRAARAPALPATPPDGRDSALEARIPGHDGPLPSALPDVEVEFNARVQCTVPAPPGRASADGRTVDVGPLVPLWLIADSTPDLVFVRRVRAQGEELYQGFLGDWPRLRDRLLSEIRDLLPDAQLLPVGPQQARDPRGHYLANLPAALIVPAVHAQSQGLLTPARLTLGLAGLVTLLASVAIGLTLHKSLELSERRRRFVSAVTHELRTPLTTFRMYSEMLADGLVRGERERGEYLQTLKEEAGRLAAMVDNVLAQSRIEERGARPVRETLRMDDLRRRLIPALERMAGAAGANLVVNASTGDAVELRVDVEAVGRVLLNLVDNAIKYGHDEEPASIELCARLEQDDLIFDVRDHGPGVDPKQERAIFEPFDRGGRDPSDAAPGIGLGLSLARDLARNMGGELTLLRPQGRGASFRFQLPRAARRA